MGNAVVGGAKAVGNLFIAAQSAIAKGVANMAGRDQTDKQTFLNMYLMLIKRWINC